MDKNINSLINKIDDVASQLIFQGKNAGLSEDKLEMLQKQINQIQINNSEKTLSSLHPKSNTNILKASENEKNKLLDSFEKRKYYKANKKAKSLIEKYPSDPFAYKILSLVYNAVGQKMEALSCSRKAIELDPTDAETHMYLGLILFDQNNIEEALHSINKALALKPNYPEAHYNKANIVKKQGLFDLAKDHYLEAVNLNPDYMGAYINLASTLVDLELFEDSRAILEYCIEKEPHDSIAHFNLGYVLYKLKKFDDAIIFLQKALDINPKYSNAHYLLGSTQLALGKHETAKNNIKKAIELDPNNVLYWKNLYTCETIKCNDKGSVLDYFSNTSSDFIKTNIAILESKLSWGKKEADYFFKEALAKISLEEKKIITNPYYIKNAKKEEILFPQQIVSLLHYGRSGTGLLHSLIDNHSQISTLPSYYLCRYFSKEIWDDLTRDGWDSVIDNFINIYEVLFDARVSNPCLDTAHKNVEYFGVKEGMTAVGINKNEYLCLDKKLFKKELSILLSNYSQIDQFTFFKLVHIIFDRILNNSNKNTIFYHLHYAIDYAKFNFIHQAPNSKWLVMVREPVTSCESWILDEFEENDYTMLVTKLSSMLLDISDPLFSNKDAVGLRLEDLKEKPRKTMPELCKWLGVKEEESLYNMTAQGKKWWGDKSSAEQPAFGIINKSKLGKVFSDRDKLVLNTLFHPFRLKFNYVNEDKNKFKKDLKLIKPFIDGLLDFEQKIVNETQVEKSKFLQSGFYLFLRSIMNRRWEELNKHGTYPVTLEHLKID